MCVQNYFHLLAIGAVLLYLARYWRNGLEAASANTVRIAACLERAEITRSLFTVSVSGYYRGRKILWKQRIHESDDFHEVYCGGASDAGIGSHLFSPEITENTRRIGNRVFYQMPSALPFSFAGPRRFNEVEISVILEELTEAASRAEARVSI